MPRPGGAMPNDVIDLVSDDEDISHLVPVADRNNFLPPPIAIAPREVTQSSIFNGLPDPTEFPSRVNAQSRAAGAGMMVSVPQYGSIPPGSSRQTFVHPTPRVNGVNKRMGVGQLPGFQPSQGYRDENAGTGVSSGSPEPNAMNASKKRRKLATGLPQPALQTGRISSAPILPPTFANSHQHQVASPSPRMSNGAQPVIPAIGGRSVITGIDRAQASVMPPPMEPEMKRVLETQILPHVHTAVRPYRDTLTHAERTEIGQFAASRLVTVPGFMAHYLKNKKTLTPAFESQMKLNAYHFVNQGVEKIVDRRIKELDPTGSRRRQYNEENLAKLANLGTANLETSDEGSTPQSEELEQPPLIQKRRRAISISSSTSYSNDHTDTEASKQNAQDSDMGRSRRAAAQLPKGAYEQKRRKRRTKEEMAAARASSLQVSESDSRTAMSSTMAQPVRSAPVQRIQEIKPRRKRRTKAEMEEARRQEAELSGHQRTVKKQRDQIAGLYQNAALSSHAGIQDEQAALAQSNVTRLHTQQSVTQPNFFSVPIRGSTMGSDLKPYVRNATRKDINRALSQLEAGEDVLSELDEINSDSFHVPFSSEELFQLRQFLIDEYKMSAGHRFPDPADQIARFMKSNKVSLPKMLKRLEQPNYGRRKSRLLYTRSIAAISNFLADNSAQAVVTPSEFPANNRERRVTSQDLISLLRAREGYGMTPDRSRRARSSFKVVANSYVEDALVRQSEWTDCSGDISSITWTGPDSFICGALAHSDSHNMQYNKPGNLMVGSISNDTVKLYSDHRVVRPIVDNEEEKENANALDSMRTTQSPWMYESVVSTTHCEKNGFSFTASFDKTVKVWSVSETGSGMSLHGTWQHDEKVNFVAASPHHERIATACASNGNAVRVYSFDSSAISQSSYDEYCGDRSGEPADELGNHAKWSYQPATMQWGKASGVVNFLLVGYSPRSITGNDNDVPELKRNSGEICLWNTSNKEQILIIAAKTQNVFEVIWHPTQPIFLAATSPHGPCDLTKTKTQVRIFHQQETGTFSNVKTLDCPGIDINELTVKANSQVECFVTASCTNGSTYVWDTGRSDQPYHVLDHGESLDNPDPDVPLDVGDSGVKFAAWGRSADRFYTGGSDGVIKAWDIRAVDGNTLVRDVMTISGGISTGVFNEDCSKLLIGDATGKIYLLSVDDSDVREDSKPTALSTAPRLAIGSQLSRAIRRPKVVIPHAEPDPPAGYVVENVEKTGPEIAQEYLESGQIVRIKEPYNFVYQGPFYSQMCRYNSEAHVNGDPNQRLLDEIWAVQQCNIKSQRELPIHTELPIPMSSSDITQHQKNLEKNKRNFYLKTGFAWDPSEMSPELWHLLDNGKLLELAEDVVYEHSFEPTPRFGMFKAWPKYTQWIREGEDENSRLTHVEEDEGLVDDDESFVPDQSADFTSFITYDNA
ncbi:hypothetical protein ONS95_010561 [Cadophora gregata]|uniref:uncharacterized protein n=1 Tax=Cadophora gregata TaxID=51156 RepID=UPI0026DDB9F3|nr:uncharacterized protein ONS95_010561 [Cadophora gregata]KAK0122319.1 hypothetical protein ONS95_010561 [Cadophora gregata]